MKKSTEELLQILKHTPDLETYLSNEQDNLKDIPLPEYLNNLCIEKNITRAQCIRQSGLDKGYGYDIFSGAKHPTRDKLLAICFGFSLSLDEVQNLLKISAYPILYAKDRRDSAIIFSLQRNYSLVITNELLFDMGLAIIN
ncbi:MAG: hypothetical protein IJA36_01965 [Lachnospiraceae bacterium]|nr:hypothetical protein [Lachnospiraceae bacterium]